MISPGRAGLQAEQLAVEGRVGGGPCEVVEGAVGDADQVPLDEDRPLFLSVFGVLDAVFHSRTAQPG